MSAPDVIGLAETAELLGVSRERIRQLRPRMPEATQLDSGPVWDRAEVLAWQLDRQSKTDGRATNGRTVVLAQYRSTRNISAAASAAGVSRATARTWLRQLGLAASLGIALIPGIGNTTPQHGNACQHVPKPVYQRICQHPY